MSPNPLAPGVYVDELSSGIHTITGVGTSTPAFLGFTVKTPDDPPTPRLVRSWTEFVDLFHRQPGVTLDALEKELKKSTEYREKLDQSRQEVQEKFKGLAVPKELAEPEFDKLLAVQNKQKNGDKLTESDKKVLSDSITKLTKSLDAYLCWDDAVKAFVAAKKHEDEIQEEYWAILQARPSFLPDAVYGFFANGGTACYIVPLIREGEFKAALQGDDLKRTGLAGLRTLHDVSMVAAPDLWIGAGGAHDKFAELVGMVVAHCSDMHNRVAVVEPPRDLNSEEVKTFLGLLPSQDSTDAEFTAVYYPWLTVLDLNGERSTVPPCGHIAGVWARTDAERGVFKAPANQNLRGVLELPTLLSDAQHGELNELGLNCMRVLPGQGLLVWGARTRSRTRDWRYLNVRRLVCFLAESIKQSSTWAVFEPNDQRLWASLRHAVASFLTDQWRQGALLGRTPAEAFYVICDDTNNTSDTIDVGKVICAVGVAPVRPAEFVHFTITQITGQPGQSS
ncbi:phage tail sheath family protein [Kitasatospora sp. NPDC127116]|uniref:phage tail sheath family protein n=1 Tax=Kitasatospora sp. NPDC127116 TaxID=3345367 RepID=UPI00362E9B61